MKLVDGVFIIWMRRNRRELFYVCFVGCVFVCVCMIVV